MMIVSLTTNNLNILDMQHLIHIGTLALRDASRVLIMFIFLTMYNLRLVAINTVMYM